MIALIYDSSGRVLQKLTGGREGIEIDIANSGHSGIFVDQDYDIGAVYVSDEAVYSIPPQPSPAHHFNYSTGQWEFDLTDAKAQKWAEIKAARDAQEFSTFDWGGYTFQCDDVSQRRIQGAVQLAQIDPSLTMDWTLADNSVHTFTASDFIQIGITLAAHVSMGHTHARLLREDIESATSEAEIEAIVW